MQLVLPLELAGKSTLEFDLYNEKGQLIHKEGDTIPPELVLKLENENHLLYKIERHFSIEDFDVEPVMDRRLIQPQSIFSEKTQESLLENSRKIIRAVTQGDSIDMKDCNELKTILIDEVSSKIDKISGINELKIHDRYTFSHTINVSSISTALGLMLKLTEQEINELTMGALLHDVGKMLIPKEVLLKPGKLEPEEFEIMKSHTTKGYNYIKAKNDIPEKIALVALEHQEKYGGTGYPKALRADEISYYAQIVSIVDVYDALTSERVYKKAFTNAEAVRIMLGDGSKSFNPMMLYRFIYIANYRNKSDIIDQ